MSKILDDLVELAKQIRRNPNLEDRIDDEKFLLDRIEKFPNYFSSVITMEYRMKLMSPFDDPDNYKDKVIKMDTARRMAHMAATDAINQINRLCNNYNMHPIFILPNELEKLDSNLEEDRRLAADIVYVFCKEVFLDSRSKERYNNIEYTTNEREMELHKISHSGYFNHSVSVDDLILQAKKDIHTTKSKEYQDDLCY